MNSDNIPNIPAILDERTASRIKISPHAGSNRASEAAHPCVRFLVASRLHPEKKALHDLGLQRIFDEGHLHEDALLRDLAEAGLKIVEQQRPYEWTKFELTGRIDGKIAVDGAFIPLELKSCSPNVFKSLRDLPPEDMVKSKYPWVRRYPGQILLYMLMQEIDTGIIVFKNKQSGEKLQKIFTLDDSALDYAEAILKKLEEVNAHVKAGTEPPAEPIDDCKGCAFAHTLCFPDQDYGPGYEIMMADGELLAKLERRETIAEIAKEYRDIDEELKGFFKGRNAVIGGFVIESKEVERKAYTVQAGKYWRVDIRRF
jgi:hypothetical protein